MELVRVREEIQVLVVLARDECGQLPVLSQVHWRQPDAGLQERRLDQLVALLGHAHQQPLQVVLGELLSDVLRELLRGLAL